MLVPNTAWAPVRVLRVLMAMAFGSVSVLANLRHLPGIHATAIDLDPGEGRLELAKIRWRELDLHGVQVLAQVIHLRRARDGNNPRLLSHQPRQRDLGGRRAFLGTERPQQLDDRLVVRHDHGGEARERRSEIVLPVEGGLCIHVHCRGQETLSQRSPWNEADSKLLARLKHPVVLDASFDERVFGLDGGNRLNRVRATNGLRAWLRKAEVQHLPGLDQPLDGARHVFDGHGEIDAVLIVEIDAIGPEALQRFLDDAPDALRPAVQSVRAIDLEAELGSDGNLVADWSERLADQLLVDIGTVDFRRVEERDAALVGIANQMDGLGPVNARPVVAATERHVAEANLRHLQASQFPRFHYMCLPLDAFR